MKKSDVIMGSPIKGGTGMNKIEGNSWEG